MFATVEECRSPEVDSIERDECKTCSHRFVRGSWGDSIHFNRHGWKFKEHGYCDSYRRADVDLIGDAITPAGFSEQATMELR